MEKYIKCCPSGDLRTSGGSAKELGLWVGVVLLISSRILPVNPSLTGAIAAGTWQGSSQAPWSVSGGGFIYKTPVFGLYLLC